MEEETTKDKAKIVKSIKHRERTKRMYWIMKQYLKPQDRAGITHLDVQQWLTITCVTFFLHMVDWRFHFVDLVSYKQIVIKDEMDTALFKQHLRHFSQASGTPFTTDPILSVFGEYAENDAGEAYRNGTLNLDTLGVNDITKEFLKELQRKENNPPEINTTVSHKGICTNYMIWNEETSTLPSG
eukprot:8097987-Ditylum_brightwellii.AAC.2